MLNAEKLEKYQKAVSDQLKLKKLEPQKLSHRHHLKFEERMQHLAWLCQEIAAGHLEDPKLSRRLGFIEGALWQMGYYSVDDFKAIGPRTPANQ